MNLLPAISMEFALRLVVIRRLSESAEVPLTFRG